jgi:hypothetical protein
MDLQAPPRYETRAAIDRLNRLLNLPYQNGMQDWDIELADPMRVNIFCNLYDTGRLDTEEKFALMRLIVASLDDLLSAGEKGNAAIVQRVEPLLRQDFALHLHTIEYWCLQEETDPENVFAVTPLLRRVWQDCFKPEYQQWLETDTT